MSLDKDFIEIEEKVTANLDELSISQVPGAQYVVVNKDRAIFEYAGGFSDVKNQKLMDGQTTMMCYSLTKTFTAAAILQLVEQGKVELDKTVEEYCPALPYDRHITPRNLLSHTSGIPNPIPLKWAHLASEHTEFDEESALDNLLAKHMLTKSKPGEKFLYSNLGYWLLGKIIEKVSGFSYPEYMKLNLLKQIGLFSADIDFVINDNAKHAKGYLTKISFMNAFKFLLLDNKLIGKGESRWTTFNNHYVNGPAFGGLIGSARSLSRFLYDQLQDKPVIFSSDMKKLFFEQQKTKDGSPINMTLGWHIKEEEGLKYYYKEGGGAGFKSEMRIYPDKGIGSIIMVNRTKFNTASVLNKTDAEFFRYG
ncbi:MAG: hypothetical protein SCALA702_09770 [Melioribacteraceae bacterium]|nr:MAG: hypothetical protein SCALA702_09770 [Melioribacteraceae bacterium]